LPSAKTALDYYDIDFENYAIVLFHPVTTEMEKMEQYAENLVDALFESGHNYIVVFPNNDLGSEFIFKAYKRLENSVRFRIFPSLRFEYFISLLKRAKFLIGNSSAGIHEAPYLGIPTVNIGRRQENRDLSTQSIIHCGNSSNEILEGIQKALKLNCQPIKVEENQAVSEKFIAALHTDTLWKIDHQKQFKDL
jgi:UDP-N-acetylglucosamine 2-epimerase (hydrolysing)